MSTIPVLSLKSYTHGAYTRKLAFANDLLAGLKEFGFIILRDHPVSPDLLQRAYALSEQLFQLPQEAKQSYISGAGAGQRGYTPFGKEHAKDSNLPDLKEFWHVGRDLPATHQLKKFFPDNIWPNEVNEFEGTFKSLFKALDDTGRIMLEALTLPLNLEKEYFARMTDSGSSILRLLHYPPVPKDVPPGAVRAAAHEDINLITLLVGASASGLELLSDGKWIPVEAGPGDIIVDSGDMLARIANDVIPATTHRVVNPQGPNLSRFSMPFFMHPNPDAVLTCIPSCKGNGAKYPDVVANDFLMERLKAIGLTK